MGKPPLEVAADEFEQAAAELELAARHLRTTARHFRDGEVSRGCAHAFAAEGHRLNAREILDRLARYHASSSNPD